eukprot:13355141-Heterocapsa_arctica.AAC.1
MRAISGRTSRIASPVNSSKAYAKLTSCKSYDISSTRLCSGKDMCFMDVDAFYNKCITDGHIIKGGF